MLLAEKQQTLEMANRNEQTLILECEKMRYENEKLKKLNSVNDTFHREISERLDSDLQYMTIFCNDPQVQLRVKILQKNLDRRVWETSINY